MRKEVPNTDNVAIWHKRRLLAMRFAQSDDQLLENALVKARELILFYRLLPSGSGGAPGVGL